MKTSLPNPTKAESRRMEIVAAHIGCVACRKHGMFNWADVNHMLTGGNRTGHSSTYPLCEWHHRGVPKNDNEKETRAVLGISLVDGSKAFYKEYGSDQELLEYTDDLVAEIEAKII